MGKWLAKFPPDKQESQTDKADTVGERAQCRDCQFLIGRFHPKYPLLNHRRKLSQRQPGCRLCNLDGWSATGICNGSSVVAAMTGSTALCREPMGGEEWTVHLTDGQRLPLSSIRGVTKPDGAAWTVREHGYDGEGPVGVRILRAEP